MACECEFAGWVRATVEGRVTRRELLARAVVLEISAEAVGTLAEAVGDFQSAWDDAWKQIKKA